MSSRDAILDRLRLKRRPVDPTPVWRSQRAFPDLAQRFAKSLTAVGGEVIEAADFSSALTALDGLLEALSARRAVVNPTPPLDGVAWRDRFPYIDWHRADEADGLRQACLAADVGVSGCVAALAETGTVVVSSGSDRSRLATLLPPVHAALVSNAQLTADLFTWTAARGGELPANLTMVSGPSKSADIGMTLVKGVHGPGRFIVILYDAA